MATLMPRPLVLRVGFDRNADLNFILPFEKASVAQIQIDWRDDSPIQIINNVGNGYAEYKYAKEGRYTVTVFPHGAAANGCWLNHLGWDATKLLSSSIMRKQWSEPLRSVETLGSLGITSLEALFFDASLSNLTLSTLDVSLVQNMSYMFHNARTFNQRLGVQRWNTSNVTDMSSMFCSVSDFDQNIGKWNVSRVRAMPGMFKCAYNFNQPIGDWDTSSCVNMSEMFRDACNFNQDVSGWDVSNVTSLASMFYGARAFNQPLDRWNVGKATFMQCMFCRAVSFNQPIGSWNVSNVSFMQEMFYCAYSFNQPLGNWDVRSVTNMDGMFADCLQFNQDIGGWNVSNVEHRNGMFRNAPKFNTAYISRWKSKKTKNHYLQ